MSQMWSYKQLCVYILLIYYQHLYARYIPVVIILHRRLVWVECIPSEIGLGGVCIPSEVGLGGVCTPSEVGLGGVCTPSDVGLGGVCTPSEVSLGGVCTTSGVSLGVMVSGHCPEYWDVYTKTRKRSSKCVCLGLILTPS